MSQRRIKHFENVWKVYEEVNENFIRRKVKSFADASRILQNYVKIFVPC